MRAQHPRGQHLVTCSGPDNCEEYFKVIGMRPKDYARWLDEDTRLTIASRQQGRSLPAPQYPPPDAYGPSTAALRGSIDRPAPYPTLSIFDVSARSTTPSYEPPDSYGLKKGSH